MQSSFFGTDGRARATTLSALLAALAAAGCAAPTLLPTAGSTGRVFAEIESEPPIRRYARISPVLSRGGQPDARGLQFLRDQGCKTIVNLRSHHSERAAAEALGFRCVELPLHADVFGSTAPTEQEVRRFFEVVLDPANQPVFFHCAHGKDRAGTMAALYRIEVDGWSNDEAIEELLAFGYNTMYRDLIDYVRAYNPLGLSLKQASTEADLASAKG
jgi:tyrosine-protein phosphatase SIW14